jgi:hypothetical protein
MPGRRRAAPMERALRAVHHQIQHGRVQDGLVAERLAGRRRAGEDENAGADHRADAERGEAPRPRCAGVSSPDLRRRRSVHRCSSSGKAHGGGPCAPPRPLPLALALRLVADLLLFEPRATPAARFALGAAFLRAVRFSFLRSMVSVTFFVFISFFSVLRIFDQLL